jgi:bifunctional DNase/RNase
VVNAYERVPQPNLESMKRLQKLLAQLNPKVAEVRVENLIDNSFMNKLETSGYIQSLYKKP